MAVNSDNQIIYDAINTWKEKCLLGDGSMLTDNKIWTKDRFNELNRLFIQNPDESDDSFMNKLERQMAAGTTEAKMLMAELLWLLFLFPTPGSMTGQTKRRIIERAWSWTGERLPLDNPYLKDLLDKGVGSVGTAFNTHRWREVNFLIIVFESWKGYDRDLLNEILNNPWRCAEWLDGIQDVGHRQMRHILLYFLFPETFERTSNQRSKLRIIKGLARQKEYQSVEVNTETKIDVDRTILAFRNVMMPQYGKDMNFYTADIRKLWEETDAEKPEKIIPKEEYEKWFDNTIRDKRVWVIASGRGGYLWDSFLDNHIVSIGWNDLGDLSTYNSQQEVLTILQEDLEEGDARPVMSAKSIYQFVNDIKEGDIIIVKKGRTHICGYGEIISGYHYDPNKKEHHNLRSVKWIKTGDWKLPKGRWIAIKTLTEFTSSKEGVYWLFQLMEDIQVPSDHVVNKTYSRKDAFEDLFLDSGLFDDILEVLSTKKNIILQGPPGVGKTYISQRIAYALIGEKDHTKVNLIQFHQSFSYEDFIQGWRPSGEGFARRDGVFYTFCRKAVENPDKAFVFIIDEINRGNLSRIFGEVMMLIESDKRSEEYAVQLTYADPNDTPFYIPPNVHVIGMMNTADRSLALVDYALRRRFAFFDLQPAFDSERFLDFLSSAQVPENLVSIITERLGDLNKEIREDSALLGPGFEIGHSYFCPGEDDDPDRSWYLKIIRTEIIPLLREYWFDRPEQVEAWEKRLKT